MIKRKNLLAIGLGIIMGLAPINICAAQPEDISDEMLETNVIMQTEEVLIEGEFAEEELQNQMDILEHEEGLNEVQYEDGIEESEESEIELPEANQEKAQGDVAIDETNFPDAIFRQYVLDKIDGDGDGKLSSVESEGVIGIYVSSIQGMDEISSLKGVEYFTALKNLECSHNQLSSLDVSRNPALEYLNCSYNQLSNLDVSYNLALKSLSCGGTQLSNLDVRHNLALEELS